MRRALAAGLAIVLVTGCGGGDEAVSTTVAPPSEVATTPSSSASVEEEVTGWAPTPEEARLAGAHVYDVVVEVLECDKVPAHTDPVRTMLLEFDEAGRHAQWIEFGGPGVFYPRTGHNEFGQTLDAQDGGQDTYTDRLTSDGFVTQYDDDGAPCFRYTYTLAAG